MPGPYEQLADPNALADAGQAAQSPEFWRALMQLQAQQSPDTLIPPPRNPAAPADWAANAVRGAAGKIADIVTLPGRAMQQGITTEEAVPWATDTALNLAGGGAPMAERGAAGAFGGRLPTFEGPIRAYHSSPHDFEQFDLGKIGTGEGAQTYGHGLYFAENPEVSGRGGQYWKAFANRFGKSSGENTATEYLARAGFDREKAAQTLRDLIANPPEYTSGYNKMTQERMRQEALQLLESDKHIGPHTYEVGINARPEEFVDWDKPLHQQPSKVLNTVYPGVNPAELDLNDLHNVLRTEAAAKDLAGAGIPGIKYLDQGSRPNASATLNPAMFPSQAAYQDALVKKMMEPRPDATSNYVVFDPKKIDIYRKYGMAGAVPAAGAAAYSQQDNR